MDKKYYVFIDKSNKIVISFKQKKGGLQMTKLNYEDDWA